jgi:hypothetical protein
MTTWTVVAGEVFDLNDRHWKVVWGEHDGPEIRTGDRLVVDVGDRRVTGQVEGIELHRLRGAPDNWVGVQIGGPAADVVQGGLEIRQIDEGDGSQQ